MTLLEDRRARAVSGDALDVDLGPADHQVDVDRRHVDPGCESPGRVERGRSRDRVRVAAADRDVRRLVLVEQVVQEHEAALSDRRFDVDQSDLAEPARAVVCGELRLEERLALRRTGLHDLAVGEAQPAALHRRAVPVQRSGESHTALGARTVGGGEDLLGREVDHDLLAPGRLRRGGEPMRALEEADPEIRPGPAEMKRGEVGARRAGAPDPGDVPRAPARPPPDPRGRGGSRRRSPPRAARRRARRRGSAPSPPSGRRSRSTPSRGGASGRA